MNKGLCIGGPDDGKISEAPGSRYMTTTDRGVCVTYTLRPIMGQTRDIWVPDNITTEQALDSLMECYQEDVTAFKEAHGG